MDSGSGSLQSSSGGDDDYDSHHHHHHQQQQQQQQQPHLFPPPPPPLFFNATIPPPSHQPLPFHLSPHNFQNLYDFPSNFNLQPTNFNHDSSNSFLNLDDVRPNPTSLRSEPTTTTFKTPTAAEGSTHHTQIPNRSTNPSPTGLHPKPTTKKRTRASRRAPTTVLTTDTTNFRAMVQEFTGIPSPPFTAPGSSSSSSSSFSRRFDLFASVRATTTNIEASGSGSGSGFHPSRSKVQLFSSLNNNNNNVTMDDQNTSRVQPAGIFSFQSLSEGTHLEPPHIHGSSTSQELLSALQNDEAWRSNSTATTTTATTTGTTANCKLKFTGSSSSSNNLQQTLLGNIVATTTTSRGERTVESWICPSD
ncbi:hypothetical protein SDJN03_01420, partial [Cucurbita argyrosperma subsp. sororia]